MKQRWSLSKCSLWLLRFVKGCLLWWSKYFMWKGVCLLATFYYTFKHLLFVWHIINEQVIAILWVKKSSKRHMHDRIHWEEYKFETKRSTNLFCGFTPTYNETQQIRAKALPSWSWCLESLYVAAISPDRQFVAFVDGRLQRTRAYWAAVLPSDPNNLKCFQVAWYCNALFVTSSD